MGGLERYPGLDLPSVEKKVRSALIYSPLADNALPAVPDDAELRKAVKRIRAAAWGKGPSAFDRWWKYVREHRYLPLLGAPGKGDPGDRARRAHCLADELSWLSYKLMARCYGALMLVASLDLRLHADFEPGEEEQWLFCQMHLPQLHLGGLPLDFLGRAQLRWVLPTLHDLWGRGVAEPEAYDAAADLLGHHGDLVRARRAADRERTAKGALPPVILMPSDGVPLAAASGPDLIDMEPPPLLSSRACPKCGAGLAFVNVIRVHDQNRVWAALYCPCCDEERDYEVNLSQLSD
jgi:hypothetical protein